MLAGCHVTGEGQQPMQYTQHVVQNVQVGAFQRSRGEASLAGDVTGERAMRTSCAALQLP